MGLSVHNLLVALILCPACSHQVSDRAVACPNCGHPVYRDEILADVRANFYRGFEAQGGMLTISRLEVKFQPHALNLSRASFTILKDDIVSVEKFNSLGIIPNGIVIRVRSGAEFKFVVAKRDQVQRSLATE